jgi:hypothetical protein
MEFFEIIQTGVATLSGFWPEDPNLSWFMKVCGLLMGMLVVLQIMTDIQQEKDLAKSLEIRNHQKSIIPSWKGKLISILSAGTGEKVEIEDVIVSSDTARIILPGHRAIILDLRLPLFITGQEVRSLGEVVSQETPQPGFWDTWRKDTVFANTVHFVFAS